MNQSSFLFDSAEENARKTLSFTRQTEADSEKIEKRSD
jgi:hypothetical protein